MALVSEQLDLKVTRPIFQAPSPLETFIGREEPIAKLVDVLTRGQVVVIRGVNDSGGMGKSELATRVAHLLRDKFSDGVLWANIQTTRPGDLLTTWARAFGGRVGQSSPHHSCRQRFSRRGSRVGESARAAEANHLGTGWARHQSRAGTGFD